MYPTPQAYRCSVIVSIRRDQRTTQCPKLSHSPARPVLRLLGLLAHVSRQSDPRIEVAVIVLAAT